MIIVLQVLLEEDPLLSHAFDVCDALGDSLSPVVVVVVVAVVHLALQSV